MKELAVARNDVVATVDDEGGLGDLLQVGVAVAARWARAVWAGRGASRSARSRTRASHLRPAFWLGRDGENKIGSHMRPCRPYCLANSSAVGGRCWDIPSPPDGPVPARIRRRTSDGMSRARTCATSPPIEWAQDVDLA